MSKKIDLSEIDVTFKRSVSPGKTSLVYKNRITKEDVTDQLSLTQRRRIVLLNSKSHTRPQPLKPITPKNTQAEITPLPVEDQEKVKAFYTSNNTNTLNNISAEGLEARLETLIAMAPLKTEKEKVLNEIACILSLSTSISLHSNRLYLLVINQQWDMINFLYHNGATADDQSLDKAIFNLRGPNEKQKAISLNLWKKAQDRIENYTIDAADWGRFKSIDDLLQDIEECASNKDKGKSLTQIFNFKNCDHIFYKAARAGEFCRILDIYIQEEKPFPTDLYFHRREEDDICIIDLIAFKKEPELFEKIMTPSLWRGQAESIDMMWENLPQTITYQYNKEDFKRRVGFETQRWAQRQAFKNKPRLKLKRRPKNRD